MVGEWWSLLILRDAFLGATRFEQFQRDLGIARNVLTQRLRHLAAQGILERRPISAKGTRHEYLLTEKGRDLFPLLLAATQWGDKWVPHPRGRRLYFVERASGKPLRELRATSATGKPLDSDQIEAKAGPGAEPAVHALLGSFEA